MKFLNSLLFILCLGFFGSPVFSQTGTPGTPNDRAREKANERPKEPERKPEPWDEADAAAMAVQCVALDTEQGKIRLEMYPDSAPETVRNFLNLVSTGALDTTTFSRVVPDFVIQGGDLYTSLNLTNELKWRAARTIPDEPSAIRHEAGIISMARPDEPNGASTNFFILTRSAETLDGKFSAFGRVIQGMGVVEAINRMPVDEEKPKDPVRINKAVVYPCSVAEPLEN